MGVDVSARPRFEVRSCRTGYLEQVFGEFSFAVNAADNMAREFGESYCIADTDLPRFEADGTPNDRIVWRQGKLTAGARRWIVVRTYELEREAIEAAIRHEEIEAQS